MPNGICATPDGKIVYASDINGGKTWKYDVQADGSLTNKTLFCNVGSDGMTLDNQGNVYCTSGGVQVFDKAGKRIERIAPPQGQQPANLAIGGKEHNILFMAARASVYTLKLKVKNWDPKAMIISALQPRLFGVPLAATPLKLKPNCILEPNGGNT